MWNFYFGLRIFQFLIVLQTAVSTAEQFIIQWNFFNLKNPRFIIESGFKSRAGYNGARTVILYQNEVFILLKNSRAGYNGAHKVYIWS